MFESRYDPVADFYEAGWPGSYGDSVSAALLDQIGAIAGLQILDVACGHGRISRELARRGGQVFGVDISAALIAKAAETERRHPLGNRYLHADISRLDGYFEAGSFDLAVCSFGLSDIDDLAGALRIVSASLRHRGQFVFSILHPCYPGVGASSGSWPTEGSYYDEGWWAADGALSSLRRQVGANHRTLSTYLNTLRSCDLWLETLQEPPPPALGDTPRYQAARYPVFLVATCSQVNNQKCHDPGLGT